MPQTPENARSIPTRRFLRHAVNLRTLKYGSHASLFTVIVLAVVILLYSLASKHNQRFDVTRTKRFTLAEQSVKLLQGLQQPMKVLGFFRLEDREREQFEDLLKQYTSRTDKLSYEVIDPDRQPALAQNYEVKSYGTIVVAGNDKKEKFFRLEESELTNAILKVTRTTKKTVYFVTGHGEPALTETGRTGYSQVKRALEEQNYVVHDLVLARQPQVPDDAAAVVLAGPKTDLLEPEIDALTTFLDRGGHLCLMIDYPDTAPRLAAFIRQYGLELSNDVVIETNPLGRLVGGDYLMPVVMNYDQHPITKDFGNTMTLFPIVRSVRVMKELPEGVSAQTLVSTSQESWAETDLKGLQEGQATFNPNSDRQGPISIAAVATITPKAESGTGGNAEASASAEPGAEPGKAETPRKGRLVVFGDAEFPNNNFIASPGNGNLFLNTVSWLAEEEDLIAIRPRKGGSSGPMILTEAQAPMIFWLPVVILPLAVFASGALVFARRRWQQ